MDLKEARGELFKALGYEPTPMQAEAHYFDIGELNRIKLVTGGERSGKSLFTSKETMSRVFEFKNGVKGLYWLVAKTYKLTDKDYEYIAEDCLKLGLCQEKDVSMAAVGPREIRIKVGGLAIKIATRSLQDILGIAAEAPDGIAICEAAQAPWESIPRILARTAEKRAWVVMSGTLETSLGWYVQKAKQYRVGNEELGRSFVFPSWGNTYCFPGGKENEELKRQEILLGHDLFMERFGGVPAMPAGLRFRNFDIMVHCGEYNYEEGKPVYLWIDPGYGHGGFFVVLAVQIYDNDVFIVDEVYLAGVVAEDIRDHCLMQRWAKDIAGGVIDIAGTQHQAMPAVAEVFAAKNIYLSSQKIGINEADDRVQTFLNRDPITHQPHLHVNSKSHGIISEFGGCLNPVTNLEASYKWKVGPEGNIIGSVPDQINNHAISALRYGLVMNFGYASGKSKTRMGSYLKW